MEPRFRVRIQRLWEYIADKRSYSKQWDNCGATMLEKKPWQRDPTNGYISVS